MRRKRLAAVLIVLLYAFFAFSGYGAAAEADTPRSAAPFTPCRLTVRYATQSALIAARQERRQMERPVVWLTHTQVSPFDLMGLMTAPLCAALRAASVLPCGSHPQRAPPSRAYLDSSDS